MKPPVVFARALAKRYRLYASPLARLAEALAPAGTTRHAEFAALDGVSFEIRPGEVVGIMGRNGSGKSTLLKLVTGVTTPTAGEVGVAGRVSALLELGTGFNPEMTGQENIWLNATLLGYAEAEIEARRADIVAFADIGEFIDRPVKTYSSGMFARLAFAVAINLDPDILIVDEILSVGDALFQAKCFRKFEDLKARGTTIIFVTHSIEQVLQHCTRALLLEGGRLVMDGAPREVSNVYLDLLFGATRGAAAEPAPHAGGQAASPWFAPGTEDRLHLRPGYNRDEHRWGNGQATILDVAVICGGEADRVAVDANAEVTVAARARFLADVASPVYGLLVKTVEGVMVYGANSRTDNPAPEAPRAAGEVVDFTFTFPAALAQGNYLLSVGVSADPGGGGDFVPLDRRYDVLLLKVLNRRALWGLADLGARFGTAT
jgi:lipopolysaccharide transport system ATP-binding protein